MCGRFTLSSSGEEIAEAFDLAEVYEWKARYNIAPSQEIPAVREEVGEGRIVVELRWGLLPAWAKDPAKMRKPINARAETAAEKPSFRSAMAKRRCLVPASGFFEWQAKGTGKDKQPFLFRRPDRLPFGIAGIWECWRGQGGEIIESVALLTTEANEVVKPVHDRMPVILAREDHALWLDPAMQDKERLEPLLQPAPPDRLEALVVSARVNDPRFDDPECIEAL